MARACRQIGLMRPPVPARPGQSASHTSLRSIADNPWAAKCAANANASFIINAQHHYPDKKTYKIRAIRTLAAGGDWQQKGAGPAFAALISKVNVRYMNDNGCRRRLLLSRCGAAQPVSEEEFEKFLLAMQEEICDEAAGAGGKSEGFGRDKWQRGPDASAGYGVTRVLEDGDLFEKAAINVSIIRGKLSGLRAEAISSRGQGVSPGTMYFAGALSLVLHPRNPYVPTFRSDIRYFQVAGLPGWFGGGADLTPCYLFPDDVKQFHSFYKAICDKYDADLYHRAKRTCDEYFYIPARGEHRGVGGIFFDDLVSFSDSEAANQAEVLSFVKDVAKGFMPSYLPIAESRRAMEYGEHERQWQLLRRGRYLEFNLLYDRGVRFGLDGGRLESIMVSAPPLVAWKYNVVPEEGSREQALVDVLREPQWWTDTGLADLRSPAVSVLREQC